jgi:hypothetical protein
MKRAPFLPCAYPTYCIPSRSLSLSLTLSIPSPSRLAKAQPYFMVPIHQGKVGGRRNGIQKRELEWDRIFAESVNPNKPHQVTAGSSPTGSQ